MNTTLQEYPYVTAHDDTGKTIQALRRARAKSAFESMRRIAEHYGYMSDAEIDSEIASARLERRTAKIRNRQILRSSVDYR